jgi:uncharacterized phage protein (TIGR02218 family)
VALQTGVLASLIEQKTHRFSTIWDIERTVDGVFLRFTDHNENITFSGNVYAPAGGFNASARESKDALRGTNVDFIGVISSGAITTKDLAEGRYRAAKITERVVDWRYPFAGAFITRKYFVESIRWNGETWEVQLGTLGRFLRHPVGKVITRSCPYVLGDADCTVDLGPFTESGLSVNTVTSRKKFRLVSATVAAQPDDWFKYGFVDWLTGDNAGFTTDVAASTGVGGNTVEIDLFISAPGAVQAGDTFDLVAGCEHTADACKTKFSNFDNHGGYPHVPGRDKVLEIPAR